MAVGPSTVDNAIGVCNYSIITAFGSITALDKQITSIIQPLFNLFSGSSVRYFIGTILTLFLTAIYKISLAIYIIATFFKNGRVIIEGDNVVLSIYAVLCQDS